MRGVAPARESGGLNHRCICEAAHARRVRAPPVAQVAPPCGRPVGGWTRHPWNGLAGHRPARRHPGGTLARWTAPAAWASGPVGRAKRHAEPAAVEPRPSPSTNTRARGDSWRTGGVKRLQRQARPRPSGQHLDQVSRLKVLLDMEVRQLHDAAPLPRARDMVLGVADTDPTRQRMVLRHAVNDQRQGRVDAVGTGKELHPLVACQVVGMPGCANARQCAPHQVTGAAHSTCGVTAKGRATSVEPRRLPARTTQSNISRTRSTRRPPRLSTRSMFGERPRKSPISDRTIRLACVP
jgi:hypothetical protein